MVWGCATGYSTQAVNSQNLQVGSSSWRFSQLFSGAALLLILLILGASLLKNFYHRVDLKICYDAAVNLRNHAEVYRISDALEHTKPPLGTLLFVPVSYLPFSILAVFWNLLLVLSIAGIPYLLIEKSGPRFSVALAVTLLCLNQINVELEVGQYNLLSLFIVLVLDRLKPRASGMGFVALVLLKPTSVLFLPYLLRQPSRERPSNRVRSFLTGVVLGLGFLSAVYGFAFGWGALVGDHQRWLEFLPLSTQKHIFNLDNLGIPGMLAPFVPLYKHSNLLLALGLAALWFLKSKINNSLLLLSSCVLAILWLSPMTWPQNYALLIVPMVWIVLELRHERQQGQKLSRSLLWGLGLYYLSSQILNYSLLGHANYQVLRSCRIQFVASALLACGCAAHLWLTSRRVTKQKRV